jgi:hypothetical protein
MKTINLEQEIEKALFRQKFKDLLRLRNTRGDAFKITARATFFEGTLQNPLRHIATTKGHLVDNALISILNLMACATGATSGTYPFWMNGVAAGSSGVPTVPSIRLGTGGGSTVHGTTALTTICNTPPNTVTGLTSNPSGGNYKTTITATWNTGTIAAITVTEAAIYCELYNSLGTFGTQITQNPTSVYLVDRISSADSDFTSFTVNTAKPLSCQYGLQIGYT